MKSKRHSANPGSWLLDTLYPASCECCDVPLRGRDALCAGCSDALPRIREPHCAICGECHDGRIDSAFHCRNCADTRFSFGFARPVLRRDPRTLDLVHRFKYGRRIHLADSLATILSESLNDPRFAQAIEEHWPLVPVPLHPARLRRRYFNQTEELARVVSRQTGLPHVPLLRRVRDTGTQTALGRKARQKNLKGAFQIERPWFRKIDVPEHGAILVDDVFTTGSTLEECASTLRRGGCSTVLAITLLRG